MLKKFNESVSDNDAVNFAEWIDKRTQNGILGRSRDSRSGHFNKWIDLRGVKVSYYSGVI